MAVAVLALAAGEVHAGVLFYSGIPATGSDAGSGIRSDQTYTAAVTGGNFPGGGLSIAGVTFSPLEGSGNSMSSTGATVSSATGTLAAGGGRSASIQADGAVGQMLSKMVFNDGAENGSEQYIVLDPATLQAGKTYDLRLYICNPSNQSRMVNLAFAGDGQAAVDTDFFNEDDATTSPGGFSDPNQVYYINYRFTWDGSTTPGVTITQRAGSSPFSFYAMTNQEVPQAMASALPPGAVAEPPAAAQPTVGATQVDSSTADVTDSDQQDVGVSSEVFYNADSLQKHGHWVEVGSYGRCWQPTEVSDDWCPYTVGSWHASNLGWAWDSDEEWGWATYHYGRWCRAEGHWYWVPGRVWAPSWCSWRYGGGHVGWAPLPPDATFSVHVGIGSWADSHYGVGPLVYNFCAVRDFGAPRVAQVIVPRQQNVTIIQNTTNVTNITNYNRVVYSGGPSFASINNTIVRAGGHAMVPVTIQRRPAVGAVGVGGKFTQLNGNVLSYAAPKVAVNEKPANLPKVAGTIPEGKVERGWGQIKDPKLVNQLKGKIARESQGLTPENAPAQLPTITSGRSGTVVNHPGAAATPGGTVQKTGPGTGVAKPGQPVTEAPGTSPRPGQPGRRPGEVMQKPGQPATPGEAVKPGQPGRKPGQAVEPGQPANVPGEPTKPGQPGRKPGQAVEPGQPANVPGEPTKPGQPGRKPGQAVEPGQPANVPGEPTKPGQPGRKPGQAVEPGQPANVPGEPTKPGQPGRKPVQAVEPGQPANVPGEPTKPGQPGRKPGGEAGKPGLPPAVPGETNKPGRKPNEGVENPVRPVAPQPEEPRPTQPSQKPAERPMEKPAERPAPPVAPAPAPKEPKNERVKPVQPAERPSQPVERPQNREVPQEPAKHREAPVAPPQPKREPSEAVEKRPQTQQPQMEKRPQPQPQAERRPQTEQPHAPAGAQPNREGGGKGKAKATPAPQ